MNPELDVQDRVLYEKLADVAGEYALDLPREDEALVRRRSQLAARMRHLPPELALALSGLLPGGGGGLPIYREAGKNVEAVQELRQATDLHRALRTGAAYGAPAAVAGGVLGHLLSGGNPVATAAGAAAGGGGVGALAHRAEKQRQARLAQHMLQRSESYQALRDQLIQQRLQAVQEQEDAARAAEDGEQLRKVSVVSPNYGRLFDLTGFTPLPGRSISRPSAVGGGSGDSSLGPTDSGRGMIWEDFYNKWSSAKEAGIFSSLAKVFGSGGRAVAEALPGLGLTEEAIAGMKGALPGEAAAAARGVASPTLAFNVSDLDPALQRFISARQALRADIGGFAPHAVARSVPLGVGASGEGGVMLGGTPPLTFGAPLSEDQLVNQVLNANKLVRPPVVDESMFARAMGAPARLPVPPISSTAYSPWEAIKSSAARLRKAAASGNAMGVTGVPKVPSPSGGGMGVPAQSAVSAPRMVAPVSAKIPSPTAQLKLPGPVTPNTNRAAGVPPATQMPLFGSRRPSA